MKSRFSLIRVRAVRIASPRSIAVIIIGLVGQDVQRRWIKWIGQLTTFVFPAISLVWKCMWRSAKYEAAAGCLSAALTVAWRWAKYETAASCLLSGALTVAWRSAKYETAAGCLSDRCTDRRLKVSKVWDGSRLFIWPVHWPSLKVS